MLIFLGYQGDRYRHRNRVRRIASGILDFTADKVWGTETVNEVAASVDTHRQCTAVIFPKRKTDEYQIIREFSADRLQEIGATAVHFLSDTNRIQTVVIDARNGEAYHLRLPEQLIPSQVFTFDAGNEQVTFLSDHERGITCLLKYITTPISIEMLPGFAPDKAWDHMTENFPVWVSDTKNNRSCLARSSNEHEIFEAFVPSELTEYDELHVAVDTKNIKTALMTATRYEMILGFAPDSLGDAEGTILGLDAKRKKVMVADENGYKLYSPNEILGVEIQKDVETVFQETTETVQKTRGNKPYSLSKGLVGDAMKPGVGALYGFSVDKKEETHSKTVNTVTAQEVLRNVRVTVTTSDLEHPKYLLNFSEDEDAAEYWHGVFTALAKR